MPYIPAGQAVHSPHVGVGYEALLKRPTEQLEHLGGALVVRLRKKPGLQKMSLLPKMPACSSVPTKVHCTRWRVAPLL